ncbi:hypothetical protein HK096_011277, partial [Nowakowskiella sp. JEL0078]
MAGYERILDDTSRSNINMFLAIPLYVLSQSVIFSTVLQLIYKENKSGSSHHLLIHGFPRQLYQWSLVVRSLASSILFCLIGISGIEVLLKPVSKVGGIPVFLASNFSNPEITLPLLIGWIMFHLMAASASNVFNVLLTKSGILRKMNITPSNFITIIEYMSVIIWTIIRWFTPGLSPTIAAVITIINPIWTLQELFIGAFNKAFNTAPIESYMLYIPACILLIHIAIFTLCTIYDLPRDVTTTANMKYTSEMKKISIGDELSDNKVLDVDNLTFGYDNEKKLLDGLSFSINRGECFALLGRNGVGKSTTMKILLGMLVPENGSASVLSESLIPFKLGKIQNVLG